MTEHANQGRCAAAYEVRYGITPDTRYREMAECSISTLRRHNPGVGIRVVEVDCRHGYDAKPIAMRTAPDAGSFTLSLDADTWVENDVTVLPCGGGIAARQGTHWTRGRIRRDKWTALFANYGLAAVPFYNSGAILCAPGVAGSLGVAWEAYCRVLRAHAEDLEDPLQPQWAEKKGTWHFTDQYALSLAISALGIHVHEWSSRQHSYEWEGESPGVIRHWSGRRWRVPDDMAPTKLTS